MATAECCGHLEFDYDGELDVSQEGLFFIWSWWLTGLVLFTLRVWRRSTVRLGLRISS